MDHEGSPTRPTIPLSSVGSSKRLINTLSAGVFEERETLAILLPGPAEETKLC